MLAKTCADFSDLEMGPDGCLYLLSDKSPTIARLDDLFAGGGTASLLDAWHLGDLDGKPEGLAFHRGRACDRRARHAKAATEISFCWSRRLRSCAPWPKLELALAVRSATDPFQGAPRTDSLLLVGRRISFERGSRSRRLSGNGSVGYYPRTRSNPARGSYEGAMNGEAFLAYANSVWSRPLSAVTSSSWTMSHHTRSMAY
jgi:hypothetical protein